MIGTSIDIGPDDQRRVKRLGNDEVHNVCTGGLGFFGLNKNGYDADLQTGIETAQQRGQINGCQRGLLKLVADPGGRRVVGVQIAGDSATELVHIGQLGLTAELDVDAYVDNVFNFPTMAEAYRIAALDIVKRRSRSTTSDACADAASAIL